MKPENFLKSYKCDCFQPKNYCNCADKLISSDALLKNVNDVTESLVEVIKLCGASKWNNKALLDVLKYYLLHFEEIVERIDAVPRKHLNKKDLMHDLACKCFMNRVEAQMTYSIMKRAFKAFYYGTNLGGVPNILFKDKLTHTPECLWAHAAQRTAQIYAAYNSKFYAEQKNLECEIKLIYKQLYGRISTRHVASDDHECVCLNCWKRITRETLKTVTVTTGMHAVDNPDEAAYLKEQELVKDKEPVAATGKSHCNCPSLSMTKRDYFHRENTESIENKSQHSPFVCRWMPISQEEFEADEASKIINIPHDISNPPNYSDTESVNECEMIFEECSEMQEEYESQEISTSLQQSAQDVTIIFDNKEIFLNKK